MSTFDLCKRERVPNKYACQIDHTIGLTKPMCSCGLRYIEREDTSQVYKGLRVFEPIPNDYFFAGYGVDQKCTNPMYTTTTSDYGWYPPSAHTAPYRFYPKSSEFSDLLAKCGMYRNYSLNTVMDTVYY